MALLEDMTDTYNDLESRASSETNWEQKYKDNDAEWRKKYRDRFFSAPAHDEPDTDDTDEKPKALSYNDLFNLDTANTMLLKEHKEEFYLLVPLNIEKYLIIENKYLYQIKELVNEDGFMYFSAINNIETLMPLMLNDLSFNETENEWLASVFNHYFIDLTGEYCQKDEKNKALLKKGDNLDYFKKILILLKKCQDEHQMINSAYIDVIRMELKNND